jgi:hypothetical protein
MAPSLRSKWILLFLFLFAFRTFYGLFEAQWWEKDVIQTYLIGLKCFTTGTWPYFGPDLNGQENRLFSSQMPGALEGLVIGLPFHALPLPETPFLFLNLMSTAGAALLAWYISKCIPRLSFGWLFLWVCITPWSLFEGSHVINPAYDFLPSVLFFIGFLETLPAFSLGLVPPFWRNAFMGFSLFWIMQFHFSYVYLAPLAAFSLFAQSKKEKGWKAPLFFAAGAAPMAVLMIPTFFKYGFSHADVASGFAVPFDLKNVLEAPTILARYFSLVCFELPRFLGIDTPGRIKFLTDRPWLMVPGFLFWIGGILQALFLFFCWFIRKHPIAAWREVKMLLLGGYLMVWVSFWFTIKEPFSHIYMVFYPLLMIYSCYCWSLFADKPKWRLAAKVLLIMGLYFQLGYALAVKPVDSLYIKREPVVKAIQDKNYHLFAERRPESIY